MNSGEVPPQPLDVVAWVTVRLHTSGAISTLGTIGDRPMALHLLDHARDALRRPVSGHLIVSPGRDVDVAPSIPTRDVGSIPLAERGDP